MKQTTFNFGYQDSLLNINAQKIRLRTVEERSKTDLINTSNGDLIATGNRNQFVQNSIGENHVE